MATQTAPVTSCPECGAKIPKAGMSLCPYCASPLQSTPGADQDRSPIVKRLLKMEEKPEFAAALKVTPPWSPEYERARNKQTQGTVLVVLGMIVTVLEFVLGSGQVTGFLFLGGVVVSALGFMLMIGGASTRSKLDGKKVLKRSASIVVRRSETSLDNVVIYFYLLQFGDGSEGEFFYPGRGVTSDPYSNGMTGVAFTRGEELLFIERVRV